MKRILSTVALTAIMSCTTCFAQDIITTQKGDKLSVQVTAVNTNDVSYKFNNLDITTSKADIVSITFSNGEKMTFGKKNKNRWYKAEKKKAKSHSHGGSSTMSNVMLYCLEGTACLALIGFLILSL